MCVFFDNTSKRLPLIQTKNVFRFQRGEGLVEIARDIGLAPYLLAPLIVQAYLIYENYQIDPSTNQVRISPKYTSFL